MESEASVIESLEAAVEAAPEIAAVEKPQETLTPEQQMETTIKILKLQQKALSDLVVLDIRNLLKMLTAPGITESTRKQIRESIERAIVMGFDYGVEVVNPVLREHGALGKLEVSFAAHMARLKENGMVLIADSMSKKDEELKQYETKGVETENTNNSEANNESEISQIENNENEKSIDEAQSNNSEANV